MTKPNTSKPPFLKLAEEKSKSSPDLFKVILGYQENEPHLAFLQPYTYTVLNNFYANNRDVKVEELRKLWRLILIDAIYFLRINDHREASFYETTGRQKGKVKTKMGNPLVPQVAEANVYGINELSKYFAQFTEFESTLYGADKYYRDHVIHPLNVWLTGVNLLKDYGKSFTLRSVTHASVEHIDHADPEWFEPIKGEDSYKLKLSTAELSAMWAIVALTHDLGYPLEKVEKVNDQLEKMMSQFGNIGFTRSRFSFENQHDHLVKFLLKLISSVCIPYEKIGKKKNKKGNKKAIRWTNHLRTKYYTKFSKSWEQFDHGIVSCLLLLKTLTFFIESDYSNENAKPLNSEDARQFAIRSEILHAIASHTTPKIYHLAANNLPFLLVFCDDIQEWSRPTLADMRVGVKGSAERVTIKEFHISNTKKKEPSNIAVLIEYPFIPIEDQKDFVKRIFRKWAERFRPALEDAERSFKFRWEVKFGDDGLGYVFELDNTKPSVFEKIKIDFLSEIGVYCKNHDISLLDNEIKK
ncbi:MAG: hypothetical protein ACWGKN_15980 [Desulfoprunum sp.]